MNIKNHGSHYKKNFTSHLVRKYNRNLFVFGATAPIGPPYSRGF